MSSALYRTYNKDWGRPLFVGTEFEDWTKLDFVSSFQEKNIVQVD
jgi:hypothetical protein